MKAPLAIVLSVTLAVVSAAAAMCPYCAVESQTLTEEIAGSDCVVIARLAVPSSRGAVLPAPGEAADFDPDSAKATFAIDRVVKGDDRLLGATEVRALFFGEAKSGDRFLLRGMGDPLDWAVPIPMSDVALEYLGKLQELPAEGPDRLRFFLPYLQHPDILLSQDAYDEFARASYAEVLGITQDLDPAALRQWIEAPDVSPSRRSLYFTLLGASGSEKDLPWLEAMMLSDRRVLESASRVATIFTVATGGSHLGVAMPDMVSMEERRKQLGFNALVGCYLKLKGPSGLDLIDQHFLRPPHADYSQVYAAIMALRFLGEEIDDVPLDRIKESMRLVLDKPDFAEQAITDLARWEDWTVLDRLMGMFRTADKRSYVREPIVAYMEQAAGQEGEVGERAAAAIAELEKLDPEAVKRARSLLAFGFLGRIRGGDGGATDGVETGVRPAEPEVANTDVGPMPGDITQGLPDPGADTPPPAFLSSDSVPPDANDELPTAATTEGEASPPVPAAPTPVPPVATPAPLAEQPAPNLLLAVGVPLVTLALLVALFWAILKAGP